MRKEHRLGAYTKPVDDQAAQHVHDMKTMHVRSAGYEAPEEQNDHVAPSWRAPEEDITYRSSFAGTRGSLDNHRGDAGYRDQ